MADSLLHTLFALLVWPGLLGGTVLAWFLSWLSRKLTARLQGRQGPPFYQPFFDFFKLVGKQALLPRGLHPALFYGLPLFGLIAVVFSLALLPVSGAPGLSLSGDLILLVFLLEVPALVDVLAGFATPSIYSQVGSAREALLSLAYNLPFISALIAMALYLGSFRLEDFANAPIGPVTVLAAIALFTALLARLKMNPFSIPNAEQEIVGGVHVEFNGLPLALFELTHALELAALSGVIALLFLGPVSAPWLRLLLYLLGSILVVALASLVSAATARLKVQHAFRFYWTWGAAASALVFAAALIF
jgi:NADH-quinone oxidoreductase subunit H